MVSLLPTRAAMKVLPACVLGMVLATSSCTTQDPSADTPCSATSECEGRICTDSKCNRCGDDLACQQDPFYGAGATCQNGQCVACKGQVDCACDGTSCGPGAVCEDNVCRACTVGEEDCTCFGNNTCLTGLECREGRCISCPAGAESCACNDDGSCGTDLVCVEERCVPSDCVAGQVACRCRSDETNACNEGLICNTDTSTCEICTSDTAGCACASDNTCGNGLVCDQDDQLCRVPMTCQQVMCGTQQVCMAAGNGSDARCLPSCNSGYTWNEQTMSCDVEAEANCDANASGSILAQCDAQNRTCTPMSPGASCGACKTDFVDESGTLTTCRAAMTCAQLSCATQHRECTPHTTSADAMCGACESGYTADSTGACVADTTTNCRDGDPNSILAQCTTENKTCVESPTGASCGGCITGYAMDTGSTVCVRRLCTDASVACAAKNRSCSGEPLARCGECLTGYVPSDPGDTTNTTDCRLPLTCADISCDAGEQCVSQVNQDPVCAAWPCVDAAGNPDTTQAFDEFSGSCIPCGLSCSGEGEVGRIWPYTANGQCICETEPGYYVELGGLYTARPCDKDDDGWVRVGAAAAITSGFTALFDNARCSLRTVDRFELTNEFQQTLDVLSCAGGFVPAWSCTTDADCGAAGLCTPATNTCGCAGQANPLELYESTRNDDQDTLDMQGDNDVPSYADVPSGGMVTTGRRLRASELNPLTKACISATGDYNDNGADDISEWQGAAPSGADADTIAFTHFAYFVETHKAQYEKRAADTYGRYIIKERSRCSTDFPVIYSGTVDGTYWRECTRNRDLAYDRSGANVLAGFDFAEFNCTSTVGTCSTPEPAVGPSVTGEVTPHSLCDPSVVLPPVDGVWRGMGHHSQFKCVQALSTVPTDRNTASPQKRLISELEDGAGGGEYQLNRCRVACPAGDETCATDCTADGCTASSTSVMGNPDDPSIVCETVNRANVVDGEVGFAAVRFSQADGPYTRGCINEWQPASATAEFTPWKSLCPGYTDSGASTGQGNPYNFGKLLCGCTYNYGGITCDEGCVTEELHVGGDCDGDLTGYCPLDPETGGRNGWWLCGAPTTSSYENTGTNGPELSDGTSGWRLVGSVPMDGIARERLTTADGGTAGWTVW